MDVNAQFKYCGICLTGELLAVCAAFSFGLSSVAIAKGAETSSVETGVLLSAIMTGLLAGGAWKVLGGSTNAIGAAEVTWVAIGWFVTSGLLAAVGGRTTMFKAIELAGVIRASTTRRLIPFMSVFLSWLVINEQISLMVGAGMAMIGFGFVMLFWDNRSSLKMPTGDPQRRSLVSRGLAFGVASAFLYALSFIARKFGLVGTPDAFFGAFIGALTAIMFYAAASTFSRRYRSIAKSALTAPDPWQLLAALLMSIGQISQFGALMLTGVGRVAFINSIEVYITMFFAVVVFRTEPMPGKMVIAATLLATAGAVLIAVRS